MRMSCGEIRILKSVVHTGTKMELIKYAASTERGKIEEKPSKIPCKQGENRVIMCFELSGNNKNFIFVILNDRQSK